MPSPPHNGPTRRAALFAVLAIAGCSSPEPAYFTLAARPGTPRPGRGRSVELRRVTLPGYLDRTGIVRSASGYRLAVTANERWGEPLGDLVGRVLAEDLTQRLPSATVVTEAGGLNIDAELVIEIDLQRLDADADGRVILLAQAAVRAKRGRGGTTTRSLRVETTPDSTSTASFAQAISVALGQLADALAEMVLATRT
jgi:uncharacterized lipoprotein YmbA